MKPMPTRIWICPQCRVVAEDDPAKVDCATCREDTGTECKGPHPYTCADEARIEVTLQELSDCGINPFAAKLIAESFASHPNPKEATFRYRNAVFHMKPLKDGGAT